MLQEFKRNVKHYKKLKELTNVKQKIKNCKKHRESKLREKTYRKITQE